MIINPDGLPKGSCLNIYSFHLQQQDENSNQRPSRRSVCNFLPRRTALITTQLQAPEHHANFRHSTMGRL